MTEPKKPDLTPEEVEAIQGMPPSVAVGYLNAARNALKQRQKDKQ